ncbi:ABC transporter substrate-binding protein [Jiella sp. MQZ9-1]|uniref:ABC transporter substrate-binding protein n=1 Tax=Jiella flava TaxID=2816857 RepID=A0A939FWV1_9HYPH|nr:sugar ABC transporter substrate-binding protein [Jiella flava]MBO0662982.1 ABC transporter substrate-binding protein [Jiella flava]MCD2471258.1 ABC transporter substrate-binding protein [Jiella flava]
MQRREFIKVAAGGVAMTAVSSLLGGAAWAAADKCIVPWSSDTPMVKREAKKGPFKIALSNSYIGNTWRTEMVQIAKSYTERPEVKPLIASFQATSSGNEVSAQIAQMNQMILSGVDAIIVNAASPTGLNSVIDQAVDAGILVVSFDNVVTTKKAILVNQDQYEMGKKWADFIVDKTGGKGNILVVRGVAGTFVDQERTRAANDIFGKHPDIKTTEVYGNWDDGTAQKVVANALAAGTKFDGVWSQGGDTGVVRAFQQAGLKIPPIAGEAENGFRKLDSELKFPMLSIGQSPALSALSIMVALDALQGKEVPQAVSAPLPIVTTDTLKEGTNFFPKIGDSFFTAISIPVCGLDFTAEQILKQKV